MTVAGYASIQIDRIRRLRKRLMFFIAGGPGANFASVVLIAILANVVDLNGSWIATPTATFAYVSLVLCLMSLSPIGSRGYWTDGARIKALVTSREKARRWFCLAALGNAYRSGKAPKSWCSTWTKAATSLRDGSMDEVSGCLLAYFSASDRKQADLAAGYLERCLELTNLVGPTLRDVLALEAAVFQAWDRNDIEKATQWLQRVKALNRLPPLSRLRVAIAMDGAKKDFESAIGNWGQGQSLIERLPATKIRELMLSSWAEWRTEILERREIQPAVASQSSQG